MKIRLNRNSISQHFRDTLTQSTKTFRPRQTQCTGTGPNAARESRSTACWVTKRVGTPWLTARKTGASATNSRNTKIGALRFIVSPPRGHDRDGHAGGDRDGIDRTVDLAQSTNLAIFAVADLGLRLFSDMRNTSIGQVETQVLQPMQPSIRSMLIVPPETAIGYPENRPVGPFGLGGGCIQLNGFRCCPFVRRDAGADTRQAEVDRRRFRQDLSELWGRR